MKHEPSVYMTRVTKREWESDVLPYSARLAYKFGALDANESTIFQGLRKQPLNLSCSIVCGHGSCLLLFRVDPMLSAEYDHGLSVGTGLRDGVHNILAVLLIDPTFVLLAPTTLAPKKF